MGSVFIGTPIVPPITTVSPAARSTPRTWLSLNRWAQIMGIDPLHFNQLFSSSLQVNVCGQPWFQYAWQDGGRIGREDVAHAISTAEWKLARFVGYALLPEWFVDEPHDTVRPSTPEMYSTGINVRTMQKSVKTLWGYVVSGGVRAKALIEDGVAVSRTDQDGDGYDETVTVLVNTSVDESEIHVYIPDKDGDDSWEIRPISVVVASGVATITFNSWQVINPEYQEGYGRTAIEADDDANYLYTVDVYRVYDDPSEQASLRWENFPNDCGCGSEDCAACTGQLQDGCLTVRNQRLGIVAYNPANWNANTGQFDPTAFAIERDPERVHLFYYAGWQDKTLPHPTIQLDRYWETVIAYFACALLENPGCACSNVSEKIKYWKEDLARSGTGEPSYQIMPSQVDAIFGTRRGAMFARNACLEEGRRIGR